MNKIRKPGADIAPPSAPSAAAQDIEFRFTGPLAEKEALTIREACTALGCGVTRLYEYINAGELEAFHLGQSRRLTRRSAEALIARRLRNSATAA
jgi:excisionase family DNA binding protein